ncbi:uncharacterized protein [Primulina huaijiensis]|uniref:uncharacterized protein n=1 Tax=Primulina huaijiensis TaxID=1492673 RepID=UPI003CC6F38C
MDIDYAILKDEPYVITENNIPDDVDLYEKWDRSDRLCVIFIKTKISAGMRGYVDQHNNVRELLKPIDEQFQSSDKALVSTVILKLSSLWLTSVRGVRKHIMKMRDIAAQFPPLAVAMSETFLVGRNVVDGNE